MSLNPTFQFGAVDLAAAPFAVAFGRDFGSPEQVVASVQSDLRDGSLTKVTKYDNRTVTIQVLIEGASLLALAEAEALLVAETLKERNEFTFNPGDGTAADSVFDTFTADLVPEYDDDREIALMRLYTLTFEAHPWPRSANKIITPAVATAAPTVVDSGSSTTNWTAPAGPTGAALSVASGAVRVTYDPSLTTTSSTFYGTVLRRTATVNVATAKYIAIDWASSKPSVYGLQTNATFGNLTEVRRGPAPTAGFTRSWFQVPDSVTSLAWLQFVIIHPAYPSGSATLDIDQVLLAATLPISGTARQLTRTIDPGGSVPAEGTIKIEHPTGGLGQTIVFSHPVVDGYSPPLRQWLVSSDTVTPYTFGYSGAYQSINGLTLYRIPAAAIPDGDVQLWARLNKGSTPGSVNIAWAAQPAFLTGSVADSQQGTTAYNFALGDTYYIVPLARLTLPVAKTGQSGTLGIAIQATGAGVFLEEAWLFAMDRGRLTVVDCGLGTPATGSISNRLRIAAPSLDEPFGSIMVGTAADWSDAYTPQASKVLCDQTGHRFDPDGSMIFTANFQEDASVSFEHYPRWHTNAAS